MSNIEQNLKKILSSRYGKDVRQAIHDGIHDCYEDGKTGAVDLVARERINNLMANNNPTEGNSELLDIRVGADGKTYESAGEAVRGQIGSLSEEIDTLNQGGLILKEDFIGQKIDEWLDLHPEATTTVKDGSITLKKMSDDVLKIIEPVYTVKAEYLGFVGDDPDFDNANIFNSLPLDYPINILFDSKTYYFSEILITKENHNINFIGTISTSHGRISNNENVDRKGITYFAPFSSEQKYIIKIGGYSDFSIPEKLQDVYFSGWTCKYINFTGKTSKAIVCIEFCSCVSIDLNFTFCRSQLLYLNSTWEIFCDILRIRDVKLGDYTKSAIYFDNAHLSGSNISAIHIKLLDAEDFDCTLIYATRHSNFTASIIDSAMIECRYNTDDVSDYLMDINTFNELKFIPLFDLEFCDGISIGIINIQGLGYKYFDTSDGKYSFSIFRVYSRYTLSVGSISIPMSSPWIKLAETNSNKPESRDLGIINIGMFNFNPKSTYYSSTVNPGDKLPSELYYNARVRIGETEAIENPSEILYLGIGRYDPYDIYSITYQRLASENVCEGIEISNSLGIPAYKKYYTDNEVNKRITRNFVCAGSKISLLIQSQWTTNAIELHYVKGSSDNKIVLNGSKDVVKFINVDLKEIDYDYLYFYNGNGWTEILNMSIS